MKLLTIGSKNSNKTVDPRIYQLIFQITFGILFAKRAEINFYHAAAVILTAIATQTVLDIKTKRKSTLSAANTACSLILLLRSDSLILMSLASFIAIGSKTIKLKEVHIFNPSNIAIVTTTTLFYPNYWVTPGRWGQEAIFIILVSFAGMLVTTTVTRWDLATIFIIGWGTVLITRAYILGDPIAIPFNELLNTSIFLFSFFMVTDPRTTPSSFKGKIIFSLLLLASCYFFRFYLFSPLYPFISLAIANSSTPFIALLTGEQRFDWAKIKNR